MMPAAPPASGPRPPEAADVPPWCRAVDLARRVAVSLPFRLVLAVAILAFHLTMMTRLGKERFDYGFDDAPGSPPVLHHPRDPEPDHWGRLVVSRWDAQHYIALGLRGFSQCRRPEQLASGEVPDDDVACELDFFPTYGFLGAGIAAATHLPMDYALFSLSLAASFAFLLMWTGREMVEGLGVGNVYLSLLLLTLFTTGFTLVTVQTEPALMALTFAAFLCLRKRWLLPGALLAGAATAIRVSGVTTGFAYCAGLALLTLRESPRPSRIWAWRAVLVPLSGWGILLMLGYFQWRFGDAMIYAHAHSRAFHHQPSFARIFIPDGRMVIESIWAEPNEGLWVAATLLWLALAHRKGLVGFTPEAQAFWYALAATTLLVCLYGSANRGYSGNSRYMLAVFPAFFGMAAVLRRRPAMLAVWLMISALHYYNGSMCFYVGQKHAQRLQRCSFARFFRSEELADRM